MSKIQVIVGSIRDGRNAEHVLKWTLNELADFGGFEVEVLDLKEWALPHFAETIATVGDFADPTYSDPIVKAWNTKLKEAEGYIVITPEYNHSIPGVLKNAIDSVFVSWALRNKPIAAVGYSVGPIAAARAVEHLAHIAVEAEAVPLRNSILIGNVANAFDEDGKIKDPASHNAALTVLEDLQWWTNALNKARAEGQLPPAAFRTRVSA